MAAEAGLLTCDKSTDGKKSLVKQKGFFFISMLNYMYTRIDMVRYCTICGNTVLNMVNCHL